MNAIPKPTPTGEHDAKRFIDCKCKVCESCTYDRALGACIYGNGAVGGPYSGYELVTSPEAPQP